jgi:hypothetical protein
MGFQFSVCVSVVQIRSLPLCSVDFYRFSVVYLCFCGLICSLSLCFCVPVLCASFSKLLILLVYPLLCFCICEVLYSVVRIQFSILLCGFVRIMLREFVRALFCEFVRVLLCEFFYNSFTWIF